MKPDASPTRKSYAQVCPLARALDVVGDRWTLLILRELLGGPARFNELLVGLPGIAKNLLTSRLRRLESDQIVRRLSPQGVVLYALTDQGEAIRPLLEELGFWGTRVRRIAPPQHERSIRAIAMALQAILVRAGDGLPQAECVVELEVGGEFLEVRLGPRPRVTALLGMDAGARVRVEETTMTAFLMGQCSDLDGFVHQSGDPAVTDQLRKALGALVAS